MMGIGKSNNQPPPNAATKSRGRTRPSATITASVNESVTKWMAPWQRWGLRGRLFAAFGAVVATTLLASSTALVSYDRLGRSLEVVIGTSLPHMTRASNIAQIEIPTALGVPI